MLTIARPSMDNPDLLLLDEPSEGLALLVVETLRSGTGELKAQRLTSLLAEQGVDLPLSLADRVYLLEKGIRPFRAGLRVIRPNRSPTQQRNVGRPLHRGH
jgi:branched-chain amino acid transport system ATP-binding protein